LLSDSCAQFDSRAGCDCRLGSNYTIHGGASSNIRCIGDGDAACDNCIVANGSEVADLDQVANDCAGTDGHVISDLNGVAKDSTVCDGQTRACLNSASNGHI
jgi:hypothetical protein